MIMHRQCCIVHNNLLLKQKFVYAGCDFCVHFLLCVLKKICATYVTFQIQAMILPDLLSMNICLGQIAFHLWSQPLRYFLSFVFLLPAVDAIMYGIVFTKFVHKNYVILLLQNFQFCPIPFEHQNVILIVIIHQTYK